jgi:hypothetical protein
MQVIGWAKFRNERTGHGLAFKGLSDGVDGLVVAHAELTARGLALPAEWVPALPAGRSLVWMLGHL